MKCENCPVTTVGLKIAANPPDANQKIELPKADFLIVTWTEAETGALAKLLGDGKYSFKTLSNNNFTPLKINGIPLPADSTCHGFFFQATVDGKSVVCFKCNYHPKVQSADTENLIKKIIVTAGTKNYKNLITTGTGGGIWDSIDVGDVVVTNQARFGLTLPAAKQALRFAGTANLKGATPGNGFATWFDFVNANLIKDNDCVSNDLFTAGGREKNSGKPKIYYQSVGANIDAVVTNTHIENNHIDEEKANLATYKIMGALLDENDAFIAQACKAVNYDNWVSIRDISDLPRSNNANQYTTYQFCSSINGDYAVWAYIMGH
jgi:nucleoside phosphorylase